MKRLITISNRLPISIVKDAAGEYQYQPSSGGLATGLKSFHSKNENLWIGWPGIDIQDADDRQLVARRMADDDMQPVFLQQQEIDDYYYGFSNKTIWPLFHYFQQFTHYNPHYWEVYQRVNHKFAEAIFEVARPDDTFWVHDYQLMLLPQLIRERFPDATIGFFLHIPFPSYEIFRTLPWRDDILTGLLGSDLIGFHTYDYVRHFLSAVKRIRDLDHSLGRLRLAGRIVDVDAFPMGIDYDKFAKAIHAPATISELVSFRNNYGRERIILSVDRLDYSKGILQRLEAFDLFLDKHPKYLGKVALTMVLVPSRSNVEHYQQLKEEIDQAVGRINGKHSLPEWTAIHYFYRSVPFATLTALYYSSDIALITPFRDGMNLISKEFVATKRDERGVLILSEMAGSAKEMIEAIFINPNDIEGIADAIYEALNMPEEEQSRRMHDMQERLKLYDVTRWTSLFIRRMNEARKLNADHQERYWNESLQHQLAEAYAGAKERLFLLDYDGTLVGFNRDPKKAYPSRQVISLVRQLAEEPRNRVVVISGRDKNFLGRYFGELPVDIVAEHGVWLRRYDPDGAEWELSTQLDDDWKGEVHQAMNSFVERTPGSFVEQKDFALAWHYRKADPGLSELRVKDLVNNLSHLTGARDLHIMEGNKVVEVKAAGVNKGAAAEKWLAEKRWDFIVALGDDYTDEDTFSVLPDEAYSFKVGYGETRARFHIPAVADVLNLLSELQARDKASQPQE